MSGDVVKQVDFGKSARDAARTFCRLFEIAEAHQADVLRDPGKYLAQASDRLIAMREGIRKAQDCLRRPYVIEEPNEAICYEEMRTIRVLKDDWDRAMACIELVKQL